MVFLLVQTPLRGGSNEVLNLLETRNLIRRVDELVSRLLLTPAMIRAFPVSPVLTLRLCLANIWFMTIGSI
jgi:hypothetical protein